MPQAMAWAKSSAWQNPTSVLVYIITAKVELLLSQTSRRLGNHVSSTLGYGSEMHFWPESLLSLWEGE